MGRFYLLKKVDFISLQWKLEPSHLLFMVEGLNKAAHTFPSIYQLLPEENDRFIEYINSDNGSYPKDHFSADTWTELKLLENAKTPKKFSGSFKCRSLDNLLNAGRDFRSTLDKWKPISTARYYYSIQHETRNKLTINTSLKANWPSPRNHNGDGRVLGNSARNEDHDPNAETHDLRGDKADEHGKLLTHGSFRADLLNWLRNFPIKRDELIINLAQKEPILKDLLLKNRIWLKSSYATYATGTLSPENVALVAQMIQHNLKVASGGSEVVLNSDQARKILSINIWPGKDITSREMRLQNNVILATTPIFNLKTRAWAANRVGHMAYEDGQYSTSEKWLETAREYADRIAVSKGQNGDLYGTILNNSGAVYIRLNQNEKAKVQFKEVGYLRKKGFDLSDPIAAKAEKNLKAADALTKE